MRELAVAALSFAFASALSAARVDVVRNGAPVADAEVCVSPASGFFSKAPVTCTPASKPLDLGGRGRWNVFARKGTTLVSSRVERVTAEEAKAKSPRLELVEAASVDATAWPLAEGEQLQFWVPSARSAFPGALVPAGTVIPLVVMKGSAVRVGAPVTLAAGETRKLEPPPARAGHVDAVVGVAFQSIPEGVGDAPAVSIADAKGRRHTAAVPLAKNDLAPGETLLFFREVPAGALTASLTGTRWKSIEAKLPATTTNIVVLEKPLEARATSKLTLSWWTPNDLTKLAATQRTCETAEEKPAAFTANLLWCGDRARDLNAYISPRDCTSVAQRELPQDAMRGEVTFEDVAAGVHFVEVGYPKLPSLRKRVEVSARETTNVDLELRYFTFFGRVTRKGEPVEAELFGTLSDRETGRFDAVLARNPGVYAFSVRTCDGKLDTNLVPEEAPVENAAFDVELPHNRVVIDVVDAKKGTPVPDAVISLAAMQEDPADPDRAWFAGGRGKTDANGRYVIEPVLSNKTVKVCAVSADHEGLCAEPFKMEKTPEKQLRLALVPVVKRYGRVITNTPIEYGQLVWFSRAGQITEMVREFQPDGRFTYKNQHAEGEILAFTEAKQPLYVMAHPRLQDGDELLVRMPNAPRRTFTVTLSEDTDEEGAFVALRIGELVVPVNMLSWHLARRGLQPSLKPGASMTVADVLATGPIRVILVPFSMAMRYMSPRIELPLVPEIGTFPQQDLGEKTAVVFGELYPERSRGVIGVAATK